MSELPTSRRRRADAERSVAAILDAAVDVLGQRPDASVEDVAAGAGVSRQTVYAHFPSREELIAATVDRISAEAIAAIDDADLDRGTAADALLRLLDASWRTFHRYPLLLDPAASTGDDARRHQPVVDRLHRLIKRGQAAGEFDRKLSPAWLVTSIIALGHAAGEQVAAGRMSHRQATNVLRRSVLRLCGAPE